jgi:hypothetical protein
MDKDERARRREEKRRREEAQKRWWIQVFLPLFAVAVLSLPSIFGIYSALEPGRGGGVAAIAAIAYEFFYVFAAFLIMQNGLRRDLVRVELVAFLMALILNVIANYRSRIAEELAAGGTLLSTFSFESFGMSLVESFALTILALIAALLMQFLPRKDAPAPTQEEEETDEEEEEEQERESSEEAVAPLAEEAAAAEEAEQTIAAERVEEDVREIYGEGEPEEEEGVAEHAAEREAESRGSGVEQELTRDMEAEEPLPESTDVSIQKKEEEEETSDEPEHPPRDTDPRA